MDIGEKEKIVEIPEPVVVPDRMPDAAPAMPAQQPSAPVEEPV